MRRTWIYQALLLAAIVAALGLIVSATNANLSRLGVETSIDFLWRRAGFEISQSLIPFNANSTIARAFVVALLNTLVLAAAAIVGASVLGLIVGTARLSRNWLVSQLATTYVELFRNIPSLLQIFFWYLVVLRSLPGFRDSLSLGEAARLNNRGLYLAAPEIMTGGGWIAAGFVVAIAAIIGLARWARHRRLVSGRAFPVTVTAIALLVAVPWLAALLGGAALDWDVPQAGRFGYEGGIVIMPEFMALVAGLSVYNATYIGEIVRSGFAAIPRGQVEAADALGLSRWLSFRLVLFPQALRVIIPPLTTVYLNLFKATSLAAAIAYPEIVSVFVGTVNNLVGQPVIIMGITLIIYVLVSLAIAVFMNWYNRRIALTRA
ncbi:MAG: ABC transporter permease subunit [Chromatiales bacterium]|nr:MAG: ABC transporter permease subunit [Chromatiales bacterium]